MSQKNGDGNGDQSEADGLKERLKVLRQSQQLTLEEVGDFVGVYKQTVHGWENGKSLPSMEAIVRLAALFGVSTDELIGADAVQIDPISANRILQYKKLLLAGYDDRQIQRLTELALELAELKHRF